MSINTKSTFCIEAGILRALREFVSSEDTKYTLTGIHFKMEPGGKTVRYAATDGHAAMTGTTGEIEGEPLPELGVVLPPTIYPTGTKPGDQLTIMIDPKGTAVVKNPLGGKGSACDFIPDSTFVDIARVFPKDVGGKENKIKPGAIKEVGLEAELMERVNRAINYATPGNSFYALRFYGDKQKQVAIIPQNTEVNFRIVVMPSRIVS